ncbi:hypothetical protein MY11210_001827 [Beauveria gryllotalpidicola]
MSPIFIAADMSVHSLFLAKAPGRLLQEPRIPPRLRKAAKVPQELWSLADDVADAWLPCTP